MPRKDRPPKGQNPRGGKREGAGRPRGSSGRGAAFKHLRQLARSRTEEGLLTIVNIMRTAKDRTAALGRCQGHPRTRLRQTAQG